MHFLTHDYTSRPDTSMFLYTHTYFRVLAICSKGRMGWDENCYRQTSFCWQKCLGIALRFGLLLFILALNIRSVGWLVSV